MTITADVEQTRVPSEEIYARREEHELALDLGRVNVFGLPCSRRELVLGDVRAQLLSLSCLQDCSAERSARERHDRTWSGESSPGKSTTNHAFFSSSRPRALRAITYAWRCSSATGIISSLREATIASLRPRWYMTMAAEYSTQPQLTTTEKMLTVAVVVPTHIPRIEDARVERPCARVERADLVYQRVLDYLRHGHEVERHQFLRGVVLAHAVHEGADVLALPVALASASPPHGSRGARNWSSSPGMLTSVLYASSYSARSR
jgi:hypothetical protein